MPVRSTKKQAAKSAKKATKAAVKTPAQKKKPESEFFTAINSLEIKQFKSIRHMKIDCKHINLFIGQPNVGKSNVLEAMALLAPQFVPDKERFFADFIRYEDFSDLFRETPTKNRIEVSSNKNSSVIYLSSQKSLFTFFMSEGQPLNNYQIELLVQKYRSTAPLNKTKTIDYCSVSNSGKVSNRLKYYFGSEADLDDAIGNPLVKKYSFKPLASYLFDRNTYLTPPNGDNYYSICLQNELLRKQISNKLLDYDLELVLEQKKPEIKIQKRNSWLVSSLPYSGIADTLQRYFFHLAAILSNDKSVLLFEEPETHSHPAYIRRLAEHIADCKNNQFFITTHSPYVLNILLERKELIDHLNVFVLEYQNHETVARKLTDKEIVEFLNYGSSIFFKI
ncbi:MAG: AAA family ATPase [Bacteroidota bacterium]|jgi:AAA15 family ATPase/GTPase